MGSFIARRILLPLMASAIASAVVVSSVAAQGILLYQDTVGHSLRRFVLDTSDWSWTHDSRFLVDVGILTRYDQLDTDGPLPPMWLPGDDVSWELVRLHCQEPFTVASHSPLGWTVPLAPDHTQPREFILAACDRMLTLATTDTVPPAAPPPLTPVQRARADSQQLNPDVVAGQLRTLLRGFDFRPGGSTSPAGPADYVGMPVGAWFLHVIATSRRLVGCTGSDATGTCTTVITDLPSAAGGNDLAWSPVTVAVRFDDGRVTRVAAVYPQRLFADDYRPSMDEIATRVLTAFVGAPRRARELTSEHLVWQAGGVRVERTKEVGETQVVWTWMAIAPRAKPTSGR